jgi:hypothetical protein
VAVAVVLVVGWCGVLYYVRPVLPPVVLKIRGEKINKVEKINFETSESLFSVYVQYVPVL